MRNEKPGLTNRQVIEALSNQCRATNSLDEVCTVLVTVTDSGDSVDSVPMMIESIENCPGDYCTKVMQVHGSIEVTEYLPRNYVLIDMSTGEIYKSEPREPKD